MGLTAALPRLDRPFEARWLAIGFIYWLALVCALEPGNLAKASIPPAWLHEVARLLAAGALGACSTPALLLIARTRRLGLIGKLLAVLAIAFILILISCVLVAWLSEGQPAPSLAAVRQQLAANFVLLVFALSLFLGLILIARASHAPRTSTTPAAAGPLVFRERGGALIVDPDAIEWVESQGNYQAIRAMGRTHLVRRTLDELEADLPADRFVRIHRRTIVALRHVLSVKALANGDALASMTDGRCLRVARGRRAGFSDALTPSAQPLGSARLTAHIE